MENTENTDEFKNIVEDWQNFSCSFCGKIAKNLVICDNDKCGAFFCDNCDLNMLLYGKKFCEICLNQEKLKIENRQKGVWKPRNVMETR